MRCLYVVPKLHEKGGIQQFSLSVYNALRERHDIELRDWRSGVGFIDRALMAFIPPSLGARRYKRIVKGIDGSGFDLTHFWHIEPSIRAKGSCGKYGVTVHGMEILSHNLREYMRRLYKESLENAEFIHANSRFTAGLVEEIFDIDKGEITIIHPALSVAISEKRIEEDVPVVGTLSRFVKRKNISAVVRALNILHDEGVEFIYRLAGTGPLKDAILDELKAARFKWEYLGEITEESKIREFYPSLDVFVLTPLQLEDDVEGFGMVYLEANAYGVPVVAARTGGIPDAVKEGVSGVFADPMNVEDIANKIRAILKDHKRYEKSAKKWAERFLPQNIAVKFERMYNG